MTSYTSVPLFGGALIVDLPSNFADVSKIRHVPDHQEVYLDKDGFTSIIFDIMERVGGAGSGPAVDGAALTTHLDDIVDSDDDTLQVWSTSSTRFSKLPEGIPAYTLIATQTPTTTPEPNPTPSNSDNLLSPDLTAIVLTLLRLEKERTDVLVTINVPHIKGEYSVDDVDMEVGKQGKLIENAVEYAAKIWETLKIKDWDLFSKV